MSTGATSPPITRLDTEAFRRKLAGLSDPLSPVTGLGEKASVKDSAIKFCSILASLYNVSEDRTSIWEHIGKAIKTSLSKVSDDDIDRFISLCLESVQADEAKTAASAPLLAVMSTAAMWEPEHRFAFLQYLGTHSYAVLVHARARWEQVKKGEIDL